MGDIKEGIIYINKKKKDLTLMEKFLLKNFKDKYKRVKKKQLSSEERLRKRTEKIEKLKEKEMEELWETVDSFRKNPKKFKNRMSKKERQILKFFNEKNTEKPKGKRAKAIKRLTEYGKTSLVAYYESKELIAMWDEIYTPKVYRTNPNKKFAKRVAGRTYDAREVALLKTLEEEIMDRLLEDPLDPMGAFRPDNIVVEYNDHIKEKKEKKHRKKLDINKLII